MAWYGMVWRSNHTIPAAYMVTGNYGLTMYNGELEGATRAIEEAAKIAKKGLHFHIFSENQAGLLRLQTPSDEPGQECQIRAIEAAKIITRKGAKVALNWVPGHTDIHGNEKADLLAKVATTIYPTQHQTSFAMIGVKIRQKAREEWMKILKKDSLATINTTHPLSYKKTFPWKLRTKLSVPRGITREVSSAFYQLKLGHGYFQSYMQRPEIPSHRLLRCADLKQARKVMKERLKGNLTIHHLLHTTKGITSPTPLWPAFYTKNSDFEALISL
ncbi:hypothetical protein DL98DRAFT_552810 [Cadophora sp. DSE1049]|nr:hypothetical protein DL98DRAFT_552810 [Cadophora sp. DSE1049]